MASVIYKEMTSQRRISGGLGKQLLDVITSGMYSDPRMTIREYIQNAADSIDLAHNLGMYANNRPCISITLDGRERVITVEDNGAGIAGTEVDSRLGSLGCSNKYGTSQRGFRGIGRLGGLAYCDTVRFETRQAAQEPVHVVEWSGKALREQVAYPSSCEHLADAVRRIGFVSTRQADRLTDPDRFFRARLINVHQFHADLLMNVKGLRDYLSQTAPVAYKSDKFRFASRIEKHIAAVQGYRSYDVVLNGMAVFRPYQVDVVARDGLNDSIHDIEFMDCVSRHGQLLCRGWFAHMEYLSALPIHVTMRGIRIRQGNIAVGDEYFLKDLFSESRFATWHIGELHFTPALKLNARRDGFEESSEYEDFLEWAAMLCRRLSWLCRQSSKDRSERKSVARLLADIERQLSIPFFIDKRHVRIFAETTERQLARLCRMMPNLGENAQQTFDSLVARLIKIKERPLFLHSVIDGRTLRGKDNRQLFVDLCRRFLLINHGLCTSAELLEVVRPYLRDGSTFEIFKRTRR